MPLSEKIENSLCDFLEESRKQEELLKKKDKIIQDIVKECEKALTSPPQLTPYILKGIIEEYKEAL